MTCRPQSGAGRAPTSGCSEAGCCRRRRLSVVSQPLSYLARSSFLTLFSGGSAPHPSSLPLSCSPCGPGRLPAWLDCYTLSPISPGVVQTQSSRAGIQLFSVFFFPLSCDFQKKIGGHVMKHSHLSSGRLFSPEKLTFTKKSQCCQVAARTPEVK